VALTGRDRDILAFERSWWTRSEVRAKEAVIGEELELSASRYYQLLSELIDDPDALAEDALLVKRLRRARERRRRTRIEGRSVGTHS
jgi:hypothetical protein